MDGVAISIIGRPRPLPGHDTPNPAHNTYTLKCEEPVYACSANSGPGRAALCARGRRPAREIATRELRSEWSISRPALALPPPTGTAARPSGPSGTLHTFGAFATAVAWRVASKPGQAPPPPTGTAARPRVLACDQ